MNRPRSDRERKRPKERRKGELWSWSVGCLSLCEAIIFDFRAVNADMDYYIMMRFLIIRDEINTFKCFRVFGTSAPMLRPSGWDCYIVINVSRLDHYEHYILWLCCAWCYYIWNCSDNVDLRLSRFTLITYSHSRWVGAVHRIAKNRGEEGRTPFSCEKKPIFKTSYNF